MIRVPVTQELFVELWERFNEATVTNTFVDEELTRAGVQNIAIPLQGSWIIFVLEGGTE